MALILVLCYPFLFFRRGQAAVSGGEDSHLQNRTDDLDNVLKVINFLEEAASFWQEKGHFQDRMAEFSQDQVAAFFQHILSEGNPGLKSLRLKLVPGNRIEGWVVLDLRAQGLRGDHNLYFEARIEQERRRVRLNFRSLYLETQRIQPEIINALIDLVAAARGLEARHLDDWYDLPEGISHIETRAGSLLIYY